MSMSKTFAAKPTQQSRGGGAGGQRGTSRGRGAFGTTSSASRNIEEQGPTTRSRSKTSAVGQPNVRSEFPPNAVTPKVAKARGRGGSTSGPPLPGRMSRPGYAQGRGRSDSSHDYDSVTRHSPERQQAVTHAGVFTMYAPNERKRQQINEMAQRETEEYARFKQENSPKYFSYVGTVGGGEVSVDQVRRQQAHDVRAQKFNRQMRQQEHRETRRRAEEANINMNKAEARRKAEENMRRQDRVAPPAEVRRKREAFLAQLEGR